MKSRKSNYVVVSWTVFVLTVFFGGSDTVLRSAKADPNDPSPINITRDSLEEADDLTRLRFDYSSVETLEFVENEPMITGDNGREIREIVAEVVDGKGTLEVGEEDDDEGTTTYVLDKLHWHTPTEHMVEGQPAAMELHLIHENEVDPSDTVVVAVLYVEGQFNDELDEIFSLLDEELDQVGDIVLPETPVVGEQIHNFDLSSLLPQSLTSFRYPGSLTTYPFTEPVQWVVLSEPLQASQASPEQITAHENVVTVPGIGTVGNARDAQPLFDREVLTDLEIDDNDD